MSIDIKDTAAVERRLWDSVEHHPTGMLGLVGETDHFQPMTAFVDRAANRLWIFTRNDTDLAHQVGTGHMAMFVHQQRDLKACIGGELRIDTDHRAIDRYWNSVVAAWYPLGRDDPHLVMLRMDCDDARVWIDDHGPVKFAWEIAKANLTKNPPHIGARSNIDFH